MIRKFLEKIQGKWVFLAIVIFSYLILLFIDFALAKDVFFKFFYLLKKILPVFVLVFVFAFFSNLFLDVEKTTKFLGKRAGIKGWLISIIGGILSSGPIYMWYPVLAEFKEKGMENSFIATFLYNRAIKIPLIPMMICYFGVPFVIVLSFYMILFSIINGMLVGKLIRSKN